MKFDSKTVVIRGYDDSVFMALYLFRIVVRIREDDKKYNYSVSRWVLANFSLIRIKLANLGRLFDVKPKYL